MDDTSIAPLPDWIVPPHGGFTADDFLQLRGLPRHTELIDGCLVFTSPQEQWHSSVVSLLRQELDRQAPARLRAIRDMAVRLDQRQVPIPDVAIIVYDYERDIATAAYAPPRLYGRRLTTSVPFEIDIDLTDVGRRPR